MVRVLFCKVGGKKESKLENKDHPTVAMLEVRPGCQKEVVIVLKILMIINIFVNICI